MQRNIKCTPERWVILKVPNGHKVYGTWAGGYLDGDSWKMNSGIKEVEEDENYYYFIGYSGSCYACNKKGYGTATSFGQGVLDNYVKKAEGQIEVLEDCDDWNLRC
jgi:hypothetical protein